MTDTTNARWAPGADLLRVRRLRQRFALSEPAARLIADLAFAEARQ